MLGWLLVEKMKSGKATTLGAASGAVAGLVAITPCAGFVGQMSPLIIGFLAGVGCYLALGLKERMHWDDSLDVIAVHGVGGLIGTLLLGFFADTAINPDGADGLFYGGGLELLGDQLVAAISVAAFSFVVTLRDRRRHPSHDRTARRRRRRADRARPDPARRGRVHRLTH